MPDDGVTGEVLRLRDWRHNVVTPALAAHKARIEEAERRLSALEPHLQRLARADEIASAVTTSMREHRKGLLTIGEKMLVVCVGLAAIADTILRALGH